MDSTTGGKERMGELGGGGKAMGGEERVAKRPRGGKKKIIGTENGRFVTKKKKGWKTRYRKCSAVGQDREN